MLVEPPGPAADPRWLIVVDWITIGCPETTSNVSASQTHRGRSVAADPAGRDSTLSGIDIVASSE